MSQLDRPRPIESTTAIDTDVHLTIPRETLADYLDEPYAHKLENEPKYQPFETSSWDQHMGESIEQRSTADPDEVERVLCEEFGLDHLILNNTALFYRTSRTDVAVALMQAYNDVLLDRFLDGRDAFFGLASVAPHRPDKAAEELDRLGDEDRIVGAYIPSTGATPPLGDSYYDPVYEAARDNDLTIVYHGSAEAFSIEFPRQDWGFDRFLEVHSMAHAWSQMMTLTSLLVQGVPEKFPALDFVFLESGIGWVPYTAFRLNKEYSIRREEAPLLEKSPEQYIRDRCYFGTQPLGEPDDPDHMRQLIDVLGTDSIVFASDYPHWDFDHPNEVNTHLETSFSGTETDTILRDNPAEAFGIEI